MNTKNFAPDCDMIVLENKEYRITIERGEDGHVWVQLADLIEGAKTNLVLGEQSETTIL